MCLMVHSSIIPILNQGFKVFASCLICHCSLFRFTCQPPEVLSCTIPGSTFTLNSIWMVPSTVVQPDIRARIRAHVSMPTIHHQWMKPYYSDLALLFFKLSYIHVFTNNFGIFLSFCLTSIFVAVKRRLSPPCCWNFTFILQRKKGLSI